MATPRPGLAYVWVTWLTPLLASEAQCEFAAWIKAHYKITKVERDDFNLAAWSAEHAKVLARRSVELSNDGWSVRLENQNKFAIKGKAGILAGKPDLVATRGTELLVSDGKTGIRRNKDWWQVLVYLFALPIAFPELTHGRTLSGEVVYPSGPIAIPGTELTAERRQMIIDLVLRIGAKESLPMVPSASECGFCDVSATDCPKRFAEGSDVPVLTSEF